MDRAHARAVGDLPPARLAVTDGELSTGLTHEAEEPPADLHRDLVLLALEAVRARYAAAVRVEIVHLEPGTSASRSSAGLPIPWPRCWHGAWYGTVSGTGRKSSGRSSPSSRSRSHSQMSYVCSETTRYQVGVVLEVEDLASLAFQHQAAARRSGDDVEPSRA